MNKISLLSKLAVSVFAVGCSAQPYQDLTNCLEGPNVNYQNGCEDFDSNSDGDVDLEDFADFSNDPYSIDKLLVSNGVEYRFFHGKHHFMTLIDEVRGTLILRPHPGDDINGWGSSWYAQPFLPGATLAHTNIEDVYVDGGIHIMASGSVSRGTNSTYGTWGSNYSFNYDPYQKKIKGDGDYSITLENILENVGDMNIFRLATNYLDNVHLLSGGIGDTGDISSVVVIGTNLNAVWIPPNQPDFFPQDITDCLSINAIGDYNEIDTVAQNPNDERIEPAFKPSMKIDFCSTDSVNMIFGAFYDTTHAQHFWSDNVGITPLILRNSPDTQFNFTVSFESESLED